MPQSQRRSRARLLRAGLVSTAAAAAVAATAAPSLAAPAPTTPATTTPATTTPSPTAATLTVTPPVATTGGTLAVSASSDLTGKPVYFAVGTCAGTPSTYVTGGAPTTSVVKGDATNTGKVALPSAFGGTITTAKAYSVCVYAGSDATSALAASGSFTYVPTAMTTPTAGLGTLTLAAPGAFAGITPATVLTTATACGPTYSAAAPAVSAVSSKTDDNTASVTLPSASLSARTYTVCVYGGTTATSAVVAQSTYTLVPAVGLSPLTGPSGGGNTLTLTTPAASPIFSATSSTAVFTTSTTCPASTSETSVVPTRTAPAAKTSTTQATVQVPTGVGGTSGTGYTVCVYNTAGDTLLGQSTANAYSAPLPASTLNSTVGAGSGVTLIVSSTNGTAFSSTATPNVYYVPQLPCPVAYPSSGGTPGTGRRMTASKATIQLPTTDAAKLAPGVWSVCLYGGTSTTPGKLLSANTYTVILVPTLTAVSPASGPAFGGSTITVSGTNLPTGQNAMTVTIGGIPLPPGMVTMIDSNTFTLVTPPHVFGSVPISIKTDNAAATLNGAFTYVNSIAVAPNAGTGMNNAAALDVQGVGFSNLNFGTDATSAHVYLVNGAYNDITGGKDAKSNGPVAECAGALPVSDVELVCLVDLTATLDSAGIAVPSGVHSTTVTAEKGSAVVTAAAAAFTQADVGRPIADTDQSVVPTGTTIIAVLSSTSAMLSQKALDDGDAVTVTIGVMHPVTATAPAQSWTLTGTSGTFSQADIGRYVVADAGIPAGTFVTAVNAAGTTATLSNATAAAVTAATLVTPNQVPSGAYTVTVVSNGAANASSTDSGYSQSVVSSAATFTVAPF